MNSMIIFHNNLNASMKEEDYGYSECSTDLDAEEVKREWEAEGCRYRK